MRNKRFDFLQLPEEFHEQHKICEFLLNQIEDFIISDTFKGLRVQEISLDKEFELIDAEHILDYLLRIGKSDEHDIIIRSNILNAIIADSCQFLQIALYSSLQQRLTVTFSLIRKPFVYNLIVILRLYLTTDFLDHFNRDDNFDTSELVQKEIIELITLSESLLFSESIKATDVYNFIFNSSLPDSLINMSNKALHPSTTRNKNNRTEIQNLNFVFSNKEDIISQWKYLYSRLPFLLMYLNEVLECIIFDHLKLDDKIHIERLAERSTYFEQNSAQLKK